MSGICFKNKHICLFKKRGSSGGVKIFHKLVAPIIQDGNLIGKITHVLVDYKQKGYTIFAENMLVTTQSAEKIKETS